MAFLIVAGITVKVISINERAPLITGDLVRAVDNSLLADYRGVKKVWDAEILCASQAEYDTLVAAIDAYEEVAVSGDALGSASPITAIVSSYTGGYNRAGISFDRSMQMTFEQV